MRQPDVITIEGFDPRNFGDMMMATASGQVAAEASEGSRISYRMQDSPYHLLGTLPRTTQRIRDKLGIASRPGHRVTPNALTSPEVKAILFCNGYIFGGHWPHEWMQHLLEDFSLAKKNGKKVVLMPQSFGPFDRSWQPDLMNEIAQSVDIIFARDEKSVEFLQSTLTDPSNVVGLCDYTPILNDQTVRQPQKNMLAVVPNIKIWEMFGEEALQTYINALHSIAEQIHRESGAQPVLVEHTRGKDERILKALESRGFKREPKFKSAMAARSFIGASRFVLSSRFHGVMNGLSQSIPSVAIGWSHKYDELMRRFGCTRFNLRYDVANAQGIVSEFLAAEDELKIQLSTKTEEIRNLLDSKLVAPLKDLFR